MKHRILKLTLALALSLALLPITALADLPQSAYDDLLKGAFTPFAGVWTNGRGESLTMHPDGSITDQSGASASPGAVTKHEGYYYWSANAAGGGGYTVHLYPVGVADNWGLQSDSTKVRLCCGQSVPGAAEELFTLTSPAASEQPAPPDAGPTLESIIVGNWFFTDATDAKGNTDRTFIDLNMGTRLRGIELRFDADGKFYQRHYYNNSGLGIASGPSEWVYEGSYRVSGNELSLQLAEQENQLLLFWRDGQTESGSYLPDKNLLQYRTSYTAGEGYIDVCILFEKDNSGKTVSPTSTTFMLGGKTVSLPAYNIDGNNYVKLRDVAKLLETRFDVRYENGKAKLYNHESYTAIGGELAALPAGAQTATASNTAFVWGKTGEAVTGLSAYLIEGNNFIKLRDIAMLFDFDVDWRDGKAWIEPENPYTPD